MTSPFGMTRKKTVLVVDDSEICIEIARAALEGAGYIVVPCDEAIGFSRIYRQTRPDLVVCDINMPALNGDKLVELVQRQKEHKCPMILHSDRPFEEVEALAKKCGADGAAPKTSDGADLVRVVQRFLRAG